MDTVWAGRRSGALLQLLFLAAVVGAAAQEIVVLDGGYPRRFEMAVDELSFPRERRSETFRTVGGRDEIVRLAEGFRAAGREAGLVLYEAGRPRTAASRRVLTRTVAVRLTPGAGGDQVLRAAAPGMREVQGLPGWFQCEATGLADGPDLAARLRAVPGVLWAEPLLARQKALKFTPNDPLFPQQWHLLNKAQFGGTPGIDLNVTNVWETRRGSGVTIGVVDDGLQHSHPDLTANYSSAVSWDFNEDDADPSPDPFFDDHGTAVAGVAAARGNNGVGVAGVAWQASLAGLRLLAYATTDAEDAAAMLHSNAFIHIKNNSWGATDNFTPPAAALEGPGPLMAAALGQGTASGRGGRGTIYLFAGGNGATAGENVNYDGYANSRHVLAVAAVNDDGGQASYSEPGACLTVSGPASDTGAACSGGRAIVTTDLAGDDGYNYAGAFCEVAQIDYTRNFTGTSAATPAVAGVVALMIEANPGLGWRDAQEVLMRSATKVSPSDLGWRTNAAGLAHNHKFGGGLANARAAVQMALSWTNLPPEETISLLQTNLSVLVPDNSPGGITNTFVVTNQGFRVEHATLAVSLPHPYHGDLAIALISPGGMESRLSEKHSSTGTGYQAWRFSSVRHWGEQAAGSWRVKIADLGGSDVGTLHALHLELHGARPAARLTLTRTNAAPRLDLRAPAPGWKYRIEGAGMLTNWSTLATVTVGTDGRASWTDTNAAPAGRFYRARLTP